MLLDDPLSAFRLLPAPRRVEDLDTPVPVLDLSRAVANIRAWQARCDAAGIANRPHIKTHKLVPLAALQLEAGAAGLTVQKLGEAEVMADAGFLDLLLTFNVVGAAKLARLAALMRRTAITVVADNAAMLPGLARAAEAGGRALGILVECDTGAGRNGVQDPAAARALARQVAATPGLAFAGLMTYPRPRGRREMAAFLTEARALIEAAGLPVPAVSGGGTPDMNSDEGLDSLTEYRAGTCIYHDRATVTAGAAGFGDCALDVLATVVSRPTPDRAIIDAGSKTLTSDLLGLTGHGLLRGTDALVRALSEEHGILDVSGLPHPPQVGDLVRIIPNHVCPVSNLFDRIAVLWDGEVAGYAAVDARGRVA